MQTAENGSDRAKGELRARYIAMLSHDVKSAISGVIGDLQQIRPEALDQTGRKHLDGAIASAMDAVRLFDGVLDLEAIETREFELNLEPHAINDFLGELHRRWSGRAAQKSIRLDMTRADDVPDEVLIDRGRLSRIIGNLIENAVKYTDHGGVHVSVHALPNSQLVFTIGDTGPGFSDEALKRLFDFRGRPATSDKPGSGLGLHIAQTLIHQMDGKIDVSNLPANGAEVTVSLPVPQLDAPTDEAGYADSDGPASVAVLPSTRLPDLSHLNILLAEDNTTNQLVVTQMLEAMGASFEVASDGVEALQLFDRQPFDLALLDIEMPRLSGLDVIRSIRSRQDDRAATPIVALTAYAMREHRERIASAGADGLIAKPILGIEDLGVAILSYYRRHAPKRQSMGFAESPAVGAPTQPDDTPPGAGAKKAGAMIDEDIFGCLEMSVGQGKMAELLQKVSTDLDNVRIGIREGLSDGATQTLRTASHILISVAGAIGAVQTQHLAEKLNAAAHQGEQSEIRRLGERCLTSIDDLLTVVEERIQR